MLTCPVITRVTFCASASSDNAGQRQALPAGTAGIAGTRAIDADQEHLLLAADTQLWHLPSAHGRTLLLS